MAKRITYDEWRELQRKHPEIAERATVRGGNGADAMQKQWSNAVPGEVDGIQFPSKCQKRVYLRLAEIYGKDRIRHNVRMPLLAGSKANGSVLYQTVDFCVVDSGKATLWIDAKTPRKSREWERGMAMWRQSWPEVILWDGIGDPSWSESQSS